MRAELLERYRALPLPTTRDEHWRFTDLEGFDPDAWGAEASAAAAVPSMLDLDVAASATIDEAGIRVDGAPDGVRFEALTDDHPLLGTPGRAGRQAPRAQRRGLGARAARPGRRRRRAREAALPARRERRRRRLALLARPGRRRARVALHARPGADLGRATTSRRTSTASTEVVVRDGAKAEIVDVQRLSRRVVALRVVSRARRARRGARLGRGRLRLRAKARSGSRTTSPAAVRHPASRAPTSPTARSISTTTRTSSTPRRIRRPTSRSRARCATMPPRSGAG